jgi:hypothetical protein
MNNTPEHSQHMNKPSHMTRVTTTTNDPPDESEFSNSNEERKSNYQNYKENDLDTTNQTAIFTGINTQQSTTASSVTTGKITDETKQQTGQIGSSSPSNEFSQLMEMLKQLKVENENIRQELKQVTQSSMAPSNIHHPTNGLYNYNYQAPNYMFQQPIPHVQMSPQMNYQLGLIQHH